MNRLALRVQLLLVQRVLRLRCPIIWSYLPQPLAFARSLGPRAVLYFRVDEYSAFRGIDRKSLEEMESVAVEVSDLCIATSPRYLHNALASARNKLWVPNGVDVTHYAERGADPYALHDAPVLFMMGTLEYWLAVELLAGVAEARREWRLVLAGPQRTDLSALTQQPNVSYLGVLDYSSLPSYVGWADVCLVPFRVLPVTKGASAAKVFQYLAAGRPVVATPYNEHAELAGLIEVADETVGDFVAAIERALREDSPERRDARRAAMASHSWSARFAEIENALRRAA